MIKSLLNKSGFTLVEVMAAMVITLVALLGMLAALEMAMEQNISTAMRDESVSIAQEHVNRFRASSFTQISTCSNTTSCASGRHNYANLQVASKIRGGGVSYNVSRWSILSPSQNSVELAVKVTYTRKGTPYVHEVHTIKGAY